MAIKIGFTFEQYQGHVVSAGPNHDRSNCPMCGAVDAHRKKRDEFRTKATWRALEITGRMMPMCNNK
jgi:hypothetical protein